MKRKAAGKLLGLLICFVMLLGMAPSVSHAADEGTTFYLVTSLAQMPKNAHVVITAEDAETKTVYALTYGDAPNSTVVTPAANGKTLQVPSLEEKYVLVQNQSNPTESNIRFSYVSNKVNYNLFLGQGTNNLEPLFKENGTGSTNLFAKFDAEKETWYVWRGNPSMSSGRGLGYAAGAFKTVNKTASVVRIWSEIPPEDLGDDGGDGDGGDDDHTRSKDAPIYGVYKRVQELNNLSDFDANTSFIVVINVDTGDGRGTQPYAISTDISLSGMCPVDTHNGEYIEVPQADRNISSCVLNVAYSNGFFTYSLLNRQPTMYAVGGVKQGSKFFAPQGGDGGAVGAFRNGKSEMRFVSGTGKNNTFYMRSNGESHYLGFNDGIKDVANGSEYKQEVEIYVLTDVLNKDGTTTNDYKSVIYYGRDGKPFATVYVKNGITLATSAPENTFWDTLNGERVQYTFIGWSDKQHAPLNWEESVNLFDYIPGENGKVGNNAIRADVLKARTGITIYGDCNDTTPDTVDKDKLPSDLYPVYIIKGIDTVATANEGEAPAPHVGLTNYDIVGVSRNTTDDDVYTDQTYKWLGSITVEIYLDGEPWGKSQQMYFKYHNDNSVDVNIKFIDETTAKKYGQPGYKDALVAFMGDGNKHNNDFFPVKDHTNQYVIDAVWVMQGQGESGLQYQYNWLTDHGGQLDNVEGGSTIKLFVTSKYAYKYYLDDVLIAVMPEDEGPYTTIETYEAFLKHAAAGNDGKGQDFWVQKDHKNGYDVLMKDGNTGTFPYTNGRGNYQLYCYFINNYPHEFTTAARPAVEPPLELVSTAWEIHDRNGAVYAPFDWSSTFEVLKSRKPYAYIKGMSARASLDDTDTMPTFHFYAYTRRPGTLIISKTVTGEEGDKNKAFHFTVTLSGTYTDAQGTHNASQITDTIGGVTFVNGKAEITLKHGESKKIVGLPIGVTYTVTEKEANQDNYVTTATGATDKIESDVVYSAVFVNNYHADDVPQTGDNSQLGLWLMLAMVSIVGMVALTATRRKVK